MHPLIHAYSYIHTQRQTTLHGPLFGFQEGSKHLHSPKPHNNFCFIITILSRTYCIYEKANTELFKNNHTTKVFHKNKMLLILNTKCEKDSSPRNVENIESQTSCTLLIMQGKVAVLLWCSSYFTLSVS
jgi:hypothetical protein